MESFQNIFQIVTAFRYYFGINVKLHKNTIKCIIIKQNKVIKTQIKCNRDIYIYTGASQ